MAQITSGVRAILSHPLVYSSFQAMMGAHKARLRFVTGYVRPTPGMKVLDIGCGPADIRAYLPAVEYWGFDISESYIRKARKRVGELGHFEFRPLEANDLDGLPKFDVVLAIGLLHHLGDKPARRVIQLAHRALARGGRLLTVDPCVDASQNLVSRMLVMNDRGQNVRDRNGYEALAKSAFEVVRSEVRHQVWIPYTHCIMECEGSRQADGITGP